MAIAGLLLAATLFAADSTALPATDDSDSAAPSDATSGAGVAPVELVPRLELRQSFVQLHSGASAHVTTAEIDIHLHEPAAAALSGTASCRPAARTARPPGSATASIQAVMLLASSPHFLAAAIAGVVLNTASQPVLGERKAAAGAGRRGGVQACSAGGCRTWSPNSRPPSRARPRGPTSISCSCGSATSSSARATTGSKLDLDTLVDFAGDSGSLLGTLEAGRLLVGRTGLFMRTSTQLLGTRQLDYSIEVGVRYLFRLAERK